MKTMLKIGNAQAFWGDQGEAAARLLQQQPDLDYITLDYLSEVSLSIMAVQRAKDAQAGYARDFVDVVKSLIPFWKQGSQVKVIANAGGLNPAGCARACAEVLRQYGCFGKRIGIVTGDDVIDALKRDPTNSLFNNLESHEPLKTVLDSLMTANAYLGAKSIVEALQKGADLVITGRVADPSLTVAPCIAHFGWKWDEHDKLAQATVAGHLIECGTQVTGGISARWLELSDPANIGFPVVEVAENGEIIVTKPKGTGGAVTIETVKEQLLYEIGDPATYISPDVTVSFMEISVKEVAKNRVLVNGAKGRQAPTTLKVSATYRDGYKAEGTLAIFGRHCREKAKRSGEVIIEKMRQAGFAPARSLVECLGGGDLIPGLPIDREEPIECLMRVCVADPRVEVVDYFAKQVAPLVTAGAPGTTGYTSGRPHARQVFGYWPCLIPAADLIAHVEILEVSK